MLTFERVEAEWMGKGLNVSRAKVPGGWLVYIVHVTGTIGQSGLAFLPDADHQWDGSSLPDANNKPAK